jgi:hypothetical protein
MLTYNPNIFAHIKPGSRRTAGRSDDAGKKRLVSAADLPPVNGMPVDGKPVRSFANQAFWHSAALALGMWTLLFATTLWGGSRHRAIATAAEWLTVAVLHLPYILLFAVMLFGAYKRLSCYFRGL